MKFRRSTGLLASSLLGFAIHLSAYGIDLDTHHFSSGAPANADTWKHRLQSDGLAQGNVAVSAPAMHSEAKRIGHNIKGADDRFAILNTTVYPWSAIGQILTSQSICTATLIGPRHLLTAGHCVYDTATDSWATSILFAPATSGDSFPFGVLTGIDAVAPKNYTRKHNDRFDYAIVLLDQPIGNQVGWLNYGSAPNGFLMNELFDLTGYPEDKANTMWDSLCFLDGLNRFYLFHSCDTLPGSSGAPVFTALASPPTVYGVHTIGRRSFSNAAVRLRAGIVATITAYIQAYP